MAEIRGFLSTFTEIIPLVMRGRLLILFSLILLAYRPECARAQTAKDTLFFNNGSIVIGKVKMIELGVIIFDPADANDITVQLRKLKAISATYREFRVETIDHQVLYGYLYPTVHNGFVNVTGRGDSTLIGLVNISTLYPVEAKFLKKLNGFISAGYSYTKSSDLGRINMDGNVEYKSKRVELGFNFSFISTIEEGEFSRDNENAGLPFNYYFHARWFAGSILSYQRNLELGIKSRWQQGLAIGNKLITGKYVQLIILSGAVVNEETSLDSDEAITLQEGTLGFRFDIFKFESPNINLSWNETGYISLTEERYRIDGDLALTWELLKTRDLEDLDLSISFYTNIDSKPPTGGDQNYDYGTVIGIRFNF